MGAFGGLQITNKGRALQAKAQAGTQLNFTKVKIGDGSLSGQSIADLTNLISSKMDLTILGIEVLAGGKAKLKSYFNNNTLVSGFYWRELGIFANDPDEGEILYCYGNAGANAEYIPAGGGPDVVERYINVLTLIGNASNITATLDTGIYATQQDFDAHLAASDPHPQYETSAEAQAKADAVQTNLTNHINASDPHSQYAMDTDLTSHADLTNTAHGATSAATASTIIARDANGRSKVAAPSAGDDIARKDTVDAVYTWAKSFGLGDLAKDISSTDLNNLSLTGFYRGNNLANAPGTGFYFILNLEHSASYRSQIALPYSQGATVNKMYFRNTYAGSTWTPWEETVTLSGTQTLTNKTLTAPRVASGDSIANSYGLEILKFVSAGGGAVNEISIANANTGLAPSISATGDDTNIHLKLTPKGTGKLVLPSASGISDANGNELILFPASVANAVNEITVSNAATGNSPTIEPTGNDVNINLNLKGKGTGVPQVNGKEIWTGGNYTKRTNVNARVNTNTTFTNGVSTQVPLQTEITDSLNEFEPSTGTLSPAESGNYGFNLQLLSTAALSASLTRAMAHVYVGGVSAGKIFDIPFNNFTAANYVFNGTVFMDLTAGQQVTIYVTFIGADVTINSGTFYSALKVVRVS